MNKVTSLYDISWQCSEEEYRADPAYSYSTIARFNREGFENLNKVFTRIDSPSLTFGSMVDTLLTGTEEEFDNKFEVALLPDISDNLALITKILFDLCHETYTNLESIPDNIISTIAQENGYYANPKYAQYRVKKIKEECNDYYDLLFLCSNKTLVSAEDYQSAGRCMERLKTCEATKWYFESDNPFESIQRFYQLKFKGSYEDISLRCMADQIIVNHSDKTIIPCDLKTTSSPEWVFYKSFYKWGYWIQAQLYWYIIRQNLDKDPLYKDYKLLDYRFIVINRYTLQPLIWIYPDTQAITDCTYGENHQYKCRNWRNIVKELNYYLTGNSILPMGISTINDIKEWLNKE